MGRRSVDPIVRHRSDAIELTVFRLEVVPTNVDQNRRVATVTIARRQEKRMFSEQDNPDQKVTD